MNGLRVCTGTDDMDKFDKFEAAIKTLSDYIETIENDVEILELGLRKLSVALNELIDECVDENYDPKLPSIQAIMRARGCLPPPCDHAFGRKRRGKGSS